MPKILLLIIVSALQIHLVLGQDRLVLKHKRKPNKVKVMDLSREFGITTTDTTYYTRIIGFTDSSVFIPVRVPSGKDTVYISTSRHIEYSKSTFFQVGDAKTVTTTDSAIVKLYRADTTEIRFADIRMIRKDWFKNRRWAEPFGWLVVGSALGVAALPIMAIDDGWRGVGDWALAEAAVLGVALPAIFIGSRATKYNLRKKWRLDSQAKMN